MAYDFVNASSQYLSTASSPVTNVPITVSGIFSKSSDDIAFSLISVQKNGGNDDRVNLQQRSTSESSSIHFRTLILNNFSPTANATDGSVLNTYYHAAGVSSSSSSRAAYINGGNKGVNTTTQAVSSFDTICIGSRFLSGVADFFIDGKASEVAIWNVALTDDEIVSLGKGFKPTRIRPQSLVFYAPLIRNLQDTRGGLALTNNNAATVADHPRVI